ncbi:glycoside hydrolase family 3 N-terminal domain-containing protein [Streptomyces sp. NRRL S-350]|uniref:glycoside hydrolase family 3 N-terminal domain-containing protein n=1 Tax=Streptomyces sp. NRRL S-350 TaxID=1463902 RepID=UPI0004C27EB4|nr:glycoside hydrolase family 3 N-terminal domain-containing protein [Streptomyces sp. NRRL S-350]
MAAFRQVARFGVALAVLGAGLAPVPLGAASERRTAQAERTVAMAALEHEDSRELAGRRIVLSYAGPTPPPGVLQTIREGRAAGVILFGENVTSPAQLAEAVDELKQAAAQAPHPYALLLMTDQEGGKVRRLPGAPELSARRTGLAANPAAAAADAGTGAARTLADAGLNVNLAPVVDVYDTPDNFIDHFERSYGHDPAAVGELGSTFVAAQQGQGVAATAKHFPGLGAAARDENTDERPVTVTVPLEQIRARGEAPYRAAITAGVRLVMASWAVYPALDPQLPAGLSPTVIQGELRGRLGFEGVTVTDAMEAGALAPYGDTGDRAVAAAEAGMDLLLCSARDPQQAEDATQALAAALDSGRLDRHAFTTAVARVDALRASIG